MSKRLTRIYTRTGDDGTTGLASGPRLPKDHARIGRSGGIDELNCTVGLLRVQVTDAPTDNLLEAVQHRLFDLGGELAMPGTAIIADARSSELEQVFDGFNADLPPLSRNSSSWRQRSGGTLPPGSRGVPASRA